MIGQLRSHETNRRIVSDNNSQLLRDSFSVSQQPPIWEPPSHYSMPVNWSPWRGAGEAVFPLMMQQGMMCTVCIVTVSIVSIICQDQSPLESEEGLPPQHRTWSRYLNMWGMENIILTGALSIPNITYMSVVCSPDSVLYVSGQLFCNIVRCSCAALRLSLIVGKL